MNRKNGETASPREKKRTRMNEECNKGYQYNNDFSNFSFTINGIMIIIRHDDGIARWPPELRFRVRFPADDAGNVGKVNIA